MAISFITVNGISTTPSARTSLTVTLGNASATVGDLAILTLLGTTTTCTGILPAGWTTLTAYDTNGTIRKGRATIAWKILEAGEPAGLVSWALPGTNAAYYSLVNIFRGTHATAPIGEALAVDVESGSTSTTLVTTDFSISYADSMKVMIYSYRDTAGVDSMNTPTGFTKTSEIFSNTGEGNGEIGAFYNASLVAAGTYGSFVTTWNNVEERMLASFVLVDAAASVPSGGGGGGSGPNGSGTASFLTHISMVYEMFNILTRDRRGRENE